MLRGSGGGMAESWGGLGRSRAHTSRAPCVRSRQLIEKHVICALAVYHNDVDFMSREWVTAWKECVSRLAKLAESTLL